MTWLSLLNTNPVTTSQTNATVRFSFVKLHNIAHVRSFSQPCENKWSLQVVSLILNFNWERIRLFNNDLH